MVEKHLLVKKYLEQHSLVESNILSFNNFINNRIQEILEDINKNITSDEFDIKFGKVRFGKPEIVEADGSINIITPTESRLRNLTYSAPIFVELSITFGEQSDSAEVEIGKIPVIVRSDACTTKDMTKEELIENHLDPSDPGGYFLVNGNERIMTMTEDLAANQPFIEEGRQGLTLRIFSQRGAYRIPTTISETKEGILEVTFSRLKNIPAIVLIKSLGLLKESEIAKHIEKEDDCLIVNIYEFTNIKSKKDALSYIAEKSGTHGTEEEVIERIERSIDSFCLPNIGTDKDSRIEKAITLCKRVKEFLSAKYDKSIRTDKDHYANKRIKLSGDLMAELFRVHMNILVKDIQYSLQKITKRKKFYSIKTIAKSTLFTHRIESAVATGSWIGERAGVTQNMDKTNYLSILSQLQRVSSMLPGEQENFKARTLHPTHYGRFCPTETPEGTEIGLRKNLALLSIISTPLKFEEEEFIKKLKSFGLEENIQGKFDVFFDGRFMGMVSDPNDFVMKMRWERRKNNIPMEFSFRSKNETNSVVISTNPGRVLRPLIIVDEGISKLRDEHLLLLEQDKMKWDDLVKEGVIEYLDAAEEEDSFISLTKEGLTKKHTHLEIDSIDVFGLITSLVPFGNHDQASRLMRGSKTLKQSLGIYAANYLVRLDTDVSILHYPQNPIVKSFVYDTLKIYPSGQNIVVAVMPYEGYNVEDALVLSKSSVDRGMSRGTYFRPYKASELHYAGGLKDDIIIPDKDVSGYRTEESYKHLESDGVVYPEAKINSGEVIIGKTTPPKFLSEAKDINIHSKKEGSTVMRQEEQGTIDAVFVTVDNEGNKIFQVRTRDARIPEPGDKFSTPHGQKGVVGLIADSKDIPFTSTGIKPDLIFNPHGIPSRMTVGYLVELLANKVAATTGRFVDGTSFSGKKVEELEEQLSGMGLSYDGKEDMYDGITGKKMNVKIYIGNMYYLRLRFLVKNRVHARATGKVALLTRQPIEGRARGGALRLGEMEQQAIVAHGASLLLKERYDSDKSIIHICSNCGSLGIKDNLNNKSYCPLCGGNEIEPVEVSYAFKLLTDELLGLHIMTNFELKNKYE
ncbi:DNA-directed RNA polymerase subunit B [Candidatus Parvarchaeota archaeon]|nr:MAG: DNA-directed RNA polymerase subunit B [Candidatus Parvarchaeota archaeon]